MSAPRRAVTVPRSARREDYRPPTREIGNAMIPNPSTPTLYPYVQEPSAPLLPALPVLDAVVVREDPPGRAPSWAAPWYRRTTAVCAAVTTTAVIATAGLTMWATAPASVPAPAPVVVAAAPAVPAPAPVTPAPAAPADASSSGDLGGVAVLAVIAGVCCLLGRGGGGKAISGTFSGKVG